MKRTSKKRALLLCLVGMIAIFIGCKELTQPDLTDTKVIITAPVDNLVTTATTNTFAWEPVDGAAKYQIQIVSPRFDSVASFIIDSMFSKTTFTNTLTPGAYQWRIRAANAGSQTNYFTRSITIQ